VIADALNFESSNEVLLLRVDPGHLCAVQQAIEMQCMQMDQWDFFIVDRKCVIGQPTLQYRIVTFALPILWTIHVTCSRMCNFNELTSVNRDE
jgi:hypothetical protein